MAKPNFTLPNKPAIKSGSILSYNYTDDFTFVPAPLTFNRDSAATRVNEKGLIEDVGYFGPELVQNGDFSQIGSEEVTNGDFSVGGVVNTSSYTLGWYSSDSGISISDGKLILQGTTGFSGRAYITDGVSSHTNVLTAGKIYKLQYDIVENDGCTSFEYYSGAGTFINAPSTEVGSYTIYMTNTVNNLFLFRNGTNGSTIKIDNVSVKEVGQNWDFGTGWSMGDGKAVKTSGTGASLSQTLPIAVIGKKYKFTFDANVTGGVANATLYGAAIPNFTTSGSQEHIVTATSTSGFNFYGNDFFEGSIDNVSVIEVLGDKPRIDYSDSLTEPSLLLEPQSTNLVTESEDFSEWSLGVNATLSYVSDVVAPDGSFGVYRLQLPATGATYIASNSFTGQNPLALSIYAKSVNTNNDFNLYDGSISSPIKTATNEWQRFDYIGNGNQFYIINSGDTFVTDIYIWGAQAEALPYATSYIPTAGSTATRLGETANNAGDVNVFNSEEGVLYAEIAALADDGTNRSISLSDGSVNNRISLLFGTSSNRIRAIVKNNNSTSFDEEYEVTSTLNYHKVAIKYKLNNFALWIDSVERFTDTSGSTPIGLNKLMFDVGSGILPFYGKTKDLKVFNKALTDRELEILTT